MKCSSMVEYLAVNQAVIGSSPITSAIFEGGVETIDTWHILITDGGRLLQPRPFLSAGSTNIVYVGIRICGG